MTESINQIVIELNKLLDDNLSLHIVSYNFDNVANQLRTLLLKIKLHKVRKYYFDKELNAIYSLENEDSISWERRYKLFNKRRSLINEKPKDETTKMRTEPSIFEFNNGAIDAYLNLEKPNENLITELIKSYNLEY